MHKSESVLEKETHEFLLNFMIQRDQRIPVRETDLMFEDETNLKSEKESRSFKLQQNTEKCPGYIGKFAVTHALTDADLKNMT